MVGGQGRADDAGMTNEQPSVQRILRRRSDERVIGGVASGLGDYFNIDPLLVRIGFVGLMVFGGMGVFLYIVAWLLVPDDATDQSAVQRALGGGPWGIVLAVVLALVGISIFFTVIAGVSQPLGGGGDGWPAVGLALVVVAVGAIFLRRGEPAADPVTATEPAQSDAVATAPVRVAVRRQRRPPSPLAGYVLGGGLAAIGLLALSANAIGATVHLGQYFGLALGVIGLGLVIGAWWGHARGLILLGLLLLPFAIAASFVTVPLEGGFGDQRFSPRSAAEVEEQYRLAGGELVLDLTRMDASSEPISIAASVAMGELAVWIPEDAALEVDATVGAGDLMVLDWFESGTSISDRQALDGAGQTFILDLEAGIGRVRVETVATEDR